MPTRKIVEVLLARRTGVVAPSVIGDIDQTVRSLLSAFRLGNRLNHEIILCDGTISVAYSLRHSSQMRIDFDGSTHREALDEFEGEVRSVIEYLRSLFGELYDEASGLMSSRNDLSAALDQSRAREALSDFCWQDSGDAIGRVSLRFGEGVIDDFQLTSSPGPALVVEPEELTFEVMSVRRSSAEVRFSGPLLSGSLRTGTRSKIHWDYRSSRSVSRFLFDSMDNEQTVTASLHGVIKANGLVGGYHLCSASIEKMIGIHFET